MLGYLVKEAEGQSGLMVAFDGEGRIVGRSRKSADLVEIVTNHVRTRELTPPTNAMRLQLRAIVDTRGSVTLLGSQVGEHPCFAERQLARHGLALVDSAFVDIDPSTGEVSTAGRPPGTETAPVVGHLALSELRGRVERCVFRSVPDSDPSTIGEVALELARAARSGSRQERLEGARRLAEQLTVLPVSTSSGTNAVSAIVDASKLGI